MSNIKLKYELNDKTIVTCKDVMNKTGINLKTVRDRLNKTRDPKAIYAELTYKQHKVFKLTDGREMTMDEMHDLTGVSKNTIAARIHKARKSGLPLVPEKMLAEPQGGVRCSVIKERMAERMYQDCDGFWALFNKI